MSGGVEKNGMQLPRKPTMAFWAESKEENHPIECFFGRGGGGSHQYAGDMYQNARSVITCDNGSERQCTQNSKYDCNVLKTQNLDAMSPKPRNDPNTAKFQFLMQCHEIWPFSGIWGYLAEIGPDRPN